MEVTKKHFLLSLLLSSTCKSALPGPFIMMLKQGVKDTLLSRPLSVYGFYQTEAGTVLEFLFRVVGKGTLALSRLTAGDTVDVLGPLGRPFTVFPDRQRILLVAGGIGVAPLSYLAEHLCALSLHKETGTSGSKSPNITLYFGANTANALVSLPKIERHCSGLRLATIDGSAGFQGNVTDLLRHDLSSFRQNELCLYACGPNPMIRSLAEVLQPTSIPCQVSVEERMACGIGACLGCSLKVKREPEGWAYCQVCTEGPVFDIRDIIWNQTET